MNKIIQVSLVTSLIISGSYAKDAKSIQEMFSESDVSGQVRLGYINNDAATAGMKDTSATAIGGQLKFETASLNGVSLGAAMYTSQAITALSGNQAEGKFNEDLTSSEKHFTELAEAYVNVNYGELNIRAGRQLIDTPLADSDDIRMAPHTFEAYVASYTLESLGLTFIGANVQRWQGVDDEYNNVINNKWSKTGEDGTWMTAALYTSDMLELGAWYYDVTKNAKAVYTDATLHVDLGSGAGLTLGAQYLSESESNNASGNPSGIDGSITGVMAEASHLGLSIGLAYNEVSITNDKIIFEGFGGGSSYTNMDTMTAGTLNGDDTTLRGDGKSFVGNIAYAFDNVNIFAAYGDFKTDANSAGNNKAHVTELDLGIEYAYNNAQMEVALYYIMGEDKESTTKTSFDDDHIQVTVNYNF